MQGMGQQPASGSNSSSWVCPSDRNLALRAQLKAGWSVKTDCDSSGLAKDAISMSETELEQIKSVLAKAQRTEKFEQERIGRLVEKLGRMKRVAAGNGVNQCFLCGSEFGLLGARSYAAMCHDCRKYVCQKNCGVDTWNSTGQPIFLCKLCSETREMWKKTGAWFYRDLPKYVLPEQRPGSSEPGWNRRNIQVPASTSSGQAQEGRPWSDEWDSVGPGRLSPESIGGSRNHGGWAAAGPFDCNRSSPVRRRMLPVAPGEPKISTAFQPRWAVREPGPGSSSSEEEGELMKRCVSVNANEPKLPQPPIRPQPAYVRPHFREASGTRGRRFTDSSSSDDAAGDQGRRDDNDADVAAVKSPRQRPTADVADDENAAATASAGGKARSPVSLERRAAALDKVPSSSKTDSPDARSIDSGVLVLHSDQSVSRPTSLGASSEHSKLNAQNSQSHSISSENMFVPISSLEKSSKLNNQIDASQEKLSKIHIDTDAVQIQPIHTPVSEALSSPDDESSSLGTIEFSLKYDPTTQTLSATLLRAKNLKAMDSNGFSDPYVKLHLLPDSTKSTKLRTRTVRRSLNPEWNEQLIYYGVTEEDRQRKTFLLTVLDEDRFGSDFLGETRIALKRLTAGREKFFNVYLEKQRPIEKGDETAEERGKLLLNLQYNTQKQVLVVGVVRCVELPGMDPNGYSDPYVKLSLKPESEKHHRSKTKVKKRTLNPIFNEQFELCVALNELTKKVLHLTVWDKDVGKQDDFIGGVQLGVNAKGERQKHWTDCIKNPNKEFQRWHKLMAEK